MKKYLLLAILFVYQSALGQMGNLFYGEQENITNSICDSITKVLPTYKFSEAEGSKSGKGFTIKLTNNNGEEITVSYSCYDDKVFLLDIVGSFAAMSSLYKYYFNDKADDSLTADLRTTNYCAPIILKYIKNKVLPISFCPAGKLWSIYSSQPN